MYEYGNTDHTGRHIIRRNKGTDTIKVWRIEPTMSDGDFVVIRSYQNAMQYAQDVVEYLMDDERNEHPLVVRIELIEATYAEYQKMLEEAG